jgi:hypothetical protein
MNENTPCKGLNFALSETAKQYLQKVLSQFAGGMSARGLVPCLSYSGGFAPEKDGKILWQYRGPNFLLGGHKPKNLHAGKCYNLLGFRVWIGKIEEILLEGRTLTIIQYGNPDPQELLVIENAGEDYLEKTMQAHSRCVSPIGLS